MPRKLDVLDRLTVKEPCRAEWHEMKGNDQVRFCDHCAKKVHNLSAMTRADALRLVEASRGGLCIRFEKTSAGSVFTRDDHVFSFPKLRLSPLAAAAFGIAITVTPAFAQEKPPPNCPKPEIVTTRKPAADGTATVRGRLTNLTSKYRGSWVTVVLSQGTATHETKTNDKGDFVFENVPVGIYTLSVGSPSFLKPLILNDIEVHAAEMVDLAITWPREEDEVEFVGFLILESPLSAAEFEKNNSISNLNPNVSGFKNAPFFDAAASGNLTELGKLFKKLKSADVLSPEKETALIYAVRARQVETVRFLLENKAAPNARSLTGRTALMLAAMNGDAEIVRLLLKHGADRMLTDREGRETLEYATSQEIADLLDTPKTK